ncbi:DUF5995 family protein [Paraconexibacter algicola]|uniref:Uncharacterized protein n=1 Tax=Paraconexibacter algicola TaxID=2133960 RepID=A0A2T4ULI4_9ACTN|nr:DUF5995 family protein [Paraconexibacter algicola]PTL60112.1 hypothetical protein C7Y72_10880 [Paraconexibacter algicola]
MGLGRNLAAALAAGALALVAPAAASAQEAPYVDWPALLPALPVPHTANTEPDCADGSDACIDATIVEMQRRLDDVVGRCSHNAVFALAYQRVTEDVRDASKAGVFRDRVWLAQEDAVFARMYFTAYDDWAAERRAGLSPAWLLAFDAARDRKVSALGNFLMAMNAHINRDFPFLLAAIGITAPDGTTRKPDHDAYNRRLAALYEPVLREVAQRFDPTADDVELGVVDNLLATTILQSWREVVWRNAERLLLARTPAAKARVARQIEAYAEVVGRGIAAATAIPPAGADARDAWCAEHGGQRPGAGAQAAAARTATRRAERQAAAARAAARRSAARRAAARRAAH